MKTQNGFPRIDPVHDVLYYQKNPLSAIFAPRNVALIGATETVGSVGRTLMWNLISNPFGGAVFPINPKRSNVLGVKAYKTIFDVPEPVDLAVIVTPAVSVPGLIKDCVEMGVKGAIVISAGFKEIGPQGVELEKQIMEHARLGGMRIIGPNCLGVMSPISGLNATFAVGMALPGKVGFISQSGALCTSVLDWSLKDKVGFSHFVSIGSMLDVDWGDLIDYLADDPNTESIVIYMETIGNARSFLSAARQVANTKPIIVIKPGRTEGAAKAAASHTGSLTGSDEVLDVAFRRAGVLRVDAIEELFYMADLFAKQPTPRGNRLTILTNAGGPGVLATDALITNGGQLAPLPAETMQSFNDLLPAAWSHNNPVDILGDASPDRYAKSLEIAANNESSDGMLVILTPQDMTDPTRTAEELVKVAEKLDKPVLASWMGGLNIDEGDALLNRNQVPTFPYPDTAARMFDYMANYSGILERLYETPTLAAYDIGQPPDAAAAEEIIQKAREEGRTILSEHESKQLLTAYQIPTVETIIARNEDEAVQAAEKIGYPVVLKLHSETITHKTDVGGVQLNLINPGVVRSAFNNIRTSLHAAVGERDESGKPHFLGVTVQPMISSEGYELILGSSIDPQFGPVILFGLGGQLVEVFKDSSLGIPPLNTTLARRMMERTRIFKALKGVRGRKPVDLQALERLVVRFSTLILEQRWIKELDINPLLASPDRILALDARIVVYEKDKLESSLPIPAIRPYPSHYVSEWTTKEGTRLIIRPIRAEDELDIVEFHKTLSDRSVYLRFLSPLEMSERANHNRLSRICHGDYDYEISLIVENPDPGKDGLRLLAAGRMTRIHGANAAHFSMLVSDQNQGKGIGKELLRQLIFVGRSEGYDWIECKMSPENQAMRKLIEGFGFEITEIEKQMQHAELRLKQQA